MKIVPVLEYQVKDVGNSTLGCKETNIGFWSREWDRVSKSVCFPEHTLF